MEIRYLKYKKEKVKRSIPLPDSSRNFRTNLEKDGRILGSGKSCESLVAVDSQFLCGLDLMRRQRHSYFEEARCLERGKKGDRRVRGRERREREGCVNLYCWSLLILSGISLCLVQFICYIKLLEEMNKNRTKARGEKEERTKDDKNKKQKREMRRRDMGRG